MLGCNKKDDFLDCVKTCYGKREYLLGILYYPSRTISFSDIKDEKELDCLITLDSPEMVYLKSKETNNELELYRENFKNFQVVEDDAHDSHKNKILITLKNGEVNEFM